MTEQIVLLQGGNHAQQRLVLRLIGLQVGRHLRRVGRDHLPLLNFDLRDCDDRDHVETEITKEQKHD